MTESYNEKVDPALGSASLEEARRLFGQNLRKIREALGQSQRDIIHLTRISPPFIEALEKGDFDILPGEVFGRGFIKNICKALNVDSEALLVEFSQCWGKGGPKSKLNPSSRPRIRGLSLASFWDALKSSTLWLATQSKRRRVPLAVLGAGAVIVVGLMLFIDRFGHLQPVSGNSPAVETAAQEPVPVPESPVAVNPQVEAAKNAESAPSDPSLAAVPAASEATVDQAINQAVEPKVAASEQTPDPNHDLSKVPAISEQQANTGVQELRLQVLEPVQVSIRKDKDKPEGAKQLLQPGSHTFEFSSKAELWVEDPAKVEIYFNNKRVKSKASAGDLRVTFRGKERSLL